MSACPPVHKLLEPFVTRYLANEDDAAETSRRIKAMIEDQSRYLPTQIAFSSLMSKFVVCGLDLLNYNDPKDVVKYKMSGLIIFDCLLDVNDEITPERRIEVANHICKVLENDKLPLVQNELILRKAASCIGHFGRIASINEIDFLQNFCFPLVMKLCAARSDSNRFAGAIVLTQLAQNSPTLIFSKRKTLFNVIWDYVADKTPLVRASAAETLESTLQLISQREPMTEYVTMALKQMDAGFLSNVAEKTVGGLLILDIIVRGTVVSSQDLQNIMRTQDLKATELIWKVFQRKDSRDSEVRQKVVEIIPSLASTFPAVFSQANTYSQPYNFLGYAIRHLTDVINAKKERTTAYIALGRLFIAMASYLKSSSQINDIFNTICLGFKDPFCPQALQCLGMIINVSVPIRKLVEVSLVDQMFRGGLSVALTDNLKIVIKYAPHIRHHAQVQLRKHILSILNRCTVLIDEIQGKTPNARSVRSSTPALASPQPTAAAAKTSKWSAGPSSLFGALKSSEAPVISLAPAAPPGYKPEEELIFALKVLSSPDFFPKQVRERTLSGSFVEDNDDSLQLLSIVRDGVVRYLDDYSPEIRSAAAETCAAVLDIIVLMIDPSLNEFKLLYQILDRLLIMGVGDDIVDIRVKVFKSLQPSLDHIVAMTENVHCLIEALNDESLEVRAAAMTVMSRVAHFDTLHVMPIVRLTLNRLIQTLNNNKDNGIKQESVQLLQALVKGSDLLIVPYVKQLMRPLMSLLNDPSAAVVVAALSTIGDLAVASPESVREHLDELTFRLIAALNDTSSESKQETAVIAMGKLVSSLTMVTDDPYQKYAGLFEGLVRAIQSVDGSSALRLQAIKTVGLLGVVETNVYTRRLNVKAECRVEEIENTDNGEDDEEDAVQINQTPNSNGKNVTISTEKKMTKMERSYFSVVIRELMNILRDSSLASYHQTAVNIAVKTIRIAGSQTPNLRELIDGITYRLYQLDSGNNLKEMLLDHFITVIQIIGRGMRGHLHTLVKLINDFFESNLQQCLDIVEALSTAFTVPDFNTVLRAVLPTFIRVIEEETTGEPSSFAAPDNQVELDPGSGGSKANASTKSAIAANGASDRSRRGSTASQISLGTASLKTSKILQKIVNLSDSLGEYRRDLIPFIIKILDCSTMSVETRKDALCTVMQLANDTNLMQEYASRIIHPLLRLMSNTEPSMQSASLTALSCMVCRLGTGYVPFIIPVRRKTHHLPLREGGAKMTKLEEYEYLVNRLLKQRPLPPEPSDMSDITIRFDDRVRNRGTTVNTNTEGPFSISIQALDTAWALAGRNNASDLVEWMRRLSIELIRQSPSPVIRSCWTLAKTYRPIAEELFNSSLNCIWEELFSGESNDVVDNNHLINGIEMALSSPQIPSNIMIALLNVAEFMDMQDKRLPIDVRLLGKQAQAANMYAKSLRYREIEFCSKNVIPTIECIDALITVNNQLGLGDRARGVLVVLKANYPKIEIQPLWLEKLFRWDDARRSYEEQIAAWKARESELSLKSNEVWMGCELGRLRCLHALGEYEELEECALRLKQQTSSNGENDENLSSVQAQSEIQRLGANAAWMLGKWGVMDEFLEGTTEKSQSGDILLENNISFYRTISAIHEQDFAKATMLISETRRQLSGSISSLLNETYSRGYRAMVSMQVLAEMEEVIDYKQAVAKAATDLEATKNDLGAVKSPLLDDKRVTASSGISSASAASGGSGVGGGGGGAAGAVDLVAKKLSLLRKWRGRLKCAPKEIEVYRQILAVHTLVAEPMEDLDSWLELVTLCRKEGMFSLCENILRKLGAPLPARRRIDSDSGTSQTNQTIDYLNCTVNDRVLFNTFKYWWNIGEKNKALAELTSFMSVCALPSALSSTGKQYSSKDATMFRVRCLLKRSDWMRELNGGDINELLAILMEARELASDHYEVWHAWAVANYEQLKKADTKDGKMQTPTHTVSFASPAVTPAQQVPFTTPGSTRGKHSYLTPRKLSSSSGSASLLNLLNIQQTDAVTSYVVEAIKGFVRSIVLGQGQPVANVLQDILRLITLWFSYGTKKGVFSILETELEKISPDNWLTVTPQLIARIHIKSLEISGLLRRLLIKVAVAHPQALVCPISVALNTNDTQQRMVATEVLREMRKLKSQLVEEATTVSRELMRVAITPHELWYDGLEQAAQLYMDNKDLPAMLLVLKELHDAMNDVSSAAPTGTSGDAAVEQGFSEGIGKIGNTTLRDVSFRHSYGKMLLEAQEWIDQFRRTGRTTDLHQAWEVYQIVFKKIKVQISTLKKLELNHISPALTNACDLSLAVPGTYKPFSPDICIKGFSPAIGVIASKQRPRRMTILGSDGQQYQFLLKGHEDLRQDERVMQLFGLINVCLNNDPATSNRHLSIVRYSVMPLSNNSGVIGWVQNCDTINQLVKQYRESKDIRLLLEVKLLQSKSLNYDKLPLMHKVELFRQVLEETTGSDLQKMLWLNSKTSDVWIERRSNFTRSLAVMSVVGYILGLGDRHPSNLMVDRISGRVVHIDFGDCFEITSTRSKYPEIIPFRLTRMLTNCMEASGTEGTYRLTCERVMRVLRDNRDSVMAMLEAFVYDPLISWRLLAQDNNEADKMISKSASMDDANPPKSPVDKIRDQLAASASPMVSTFTDNDDTSISSNRPSEIGTLREVPMRRALSTEINNEDEPLQENLNARALEVINRIQAKLTGRDFNDAEDLTVEQQVHRLVKEATNVENLCQLFTGWCPLW